MSNYLLKNKNKKSNSSCYEPAGAESMVRAGIRDSKKHREREREREASDIGETDKIICRNKTVTTSKCQNKNRSQYLVVHSTGHRKGLKIKQNLR